VINVAPAASVPEAAFRYTAAMETTDTPWPHLLAPILEELRRHPGGISEFDLIRRLQRDHDLPEFAPGALADPLSLYRTHFILFHSLYRLGECLAGSGEEVAVSCLCCRVVSRERGEDGALSHGDPLQAYYLDLDNLDGMDADQVESLLGDFWRRFARAGPRADALAVLGLSDPASATDIKAAYRRLVMRHHPDRGGDKATLQRLNRAMESLGF